MFGKLRTKHLLLLLVLLVAVWWISGLLSTRAQQRTFREDILQLDTNAITGFIITPARYKRLPPIRFSRGAEGWTMFQAKDSARADPAPLHELLRSWSHMRVSHMAGRLADVGPRYDLTDSTSDRLTIETYDGAHELRVGRSSIGQTQATFVNVPGEDQVYVVDGLLGSYADYTFGEWLPKYLVTGDPLNWRRLTFNFPGNTGYVMERAGERWTIDGAPTDSARTARFLGSLAKARGQSVTDPADTLAAIPQFRLIVEDTTRAEPIVVVVFVINTGEFIVRSSLNPATVMPFDEREEVARMFRPRAAYLPH